MMIRPLGRTGMETTALGMGCWAIGGVWDHMGSPAGWGETDDAESLKALEAAYDAGIRVFDTAANYGAGLSERLVGKALKPYRDQCVISTKFGYAIDEAAKATTPYGDPVSGDVASHVHDDCEASLRRLDTDYIDVFFFHVNQYDNDKALYVRDELEKLVDRGKIRSYGWSTDDVASARLFSEGEHCSAVQVNFSIVSDAPEMLALCDEAKISAFNRGPLAMGFLTGKYDASTTFGPTDVRSAEWVREYFQKPAVTKLDALRDILTTNGRTLAQGALAWIWAKSGWTLPIPGIRTVAQAMENAGALEKGPLTPAQLVEVERVMGRL